MKTWKAMHWQCLAMVLLLLVAFWTPASAQAVEKEISTTQARLESARAAQLNLMTPEGFEEAEKMLGEASLAYERGGKLEDIRKRLAKANEALTGIEGLQEVGQLFLKDALVARADALASDSTRYAKELWDDAEKQLREAGRKVEGGDQKEARKKAAAAEEAFRSSELMAIRTDVLERARDDRRQAVDHEAHDKARQTLAHADDLLAKAEEILQTDRYRQAEAKALAEQAAETYQHAGRIAREVKWASDDNDRRIEELIRRYEAELAKIADPLGVPVRLSAGPEAASGAISASVVSLMQDRDNLVAKLGETQEQVAQLQGELEQNYEAREELQATLQSRDLALEEKQRRERRLQEIGALFTAAEAEVLLRGNQLVVHLYGLNFPVNSSEIQPANFSILTKVQQALREFPYALTTIEGHTDSQGDEDHNQGLSQRRAEAVREYLLANMSRDGAAIRAVGYGESRPVANNESEDGRAKNRRIDVVVNLTATPAG